MAGPVLRMTERRKLPYASARVVNQVLNALLDSSLKLLWHEHLVLNDGSGCFAGAGVLAQRLGLSRDAVERGRRELARLGLLTQIGHGRGHTSTWIPVLPPACTPRTVKPSVADLAVLAERLHQHIRAVRSGGADAAICTARTPPLFSTDAATVAARAPPLGGENRAQSGGPHAATAPRGESDESDEKDSSLVMRALQAQGTARLEDYCTRHPDRPSVGIVSHRALWRECFDAV